MVDACHSEYFIRNAMTLERYLRERWQKRRLTRDYTKTGGAVHVHMDDAHLTAHPQALADSAERPHAGHDRRIAVHVHGDV